MSERAIRPADASNANDSASTSNRTAAGGVTFVPGKVGSAFSFNGVDGIVTTPLTMTYGSGASFHRHPRR